MSRNLLSTIEAAFPTFSKGQKLIANYILEHYDKAAFMTAARLGKTVGVSESTVVRFATEIGYEGYPELQKALQELIRNRLTSVQRMGVTNERLGESNVLQKVLQADRESLRRTMEQIDNSAFDQAVKAIIAARKIYIIGVRSAAALASFLNYYFTHIFEDVRNLDTGSTSVIFEQMLRIRPEDVFIAITFSRYSSRTYKAAAYAKQNGAKVIAITDSLTAPICKVANHVLVARSDMASFVDSLVAPLSLINALIVAIGLQKKDEIAQVYTRLETIWDEYHVYEKGEPDVPTP
ncbi:MAG TPA: MurR/RpiR family transcriptional regulator [Clostridiales bacterium]|nr:MurR/RpiR family transcriptional regulator [Clostridiales bacterium]